MTIYLAAWLGWGLFISIAIWYVIDRFADRKRKQHILQLENELYTKTQLATRYRKQITDLKNEVEELKTTEYYHDEKNDNLKLTDNDHSGTYYTTDSVPFDDVLKCKRCGSDDFRETNCYYICNKCNSRHKKE
jgi:hypothetical protein